MIRRSSDLSNHGRPFTRTQPNPEADWWRYQYLAELARIPTMRELGRLPLPCDKGGECTADKVGSSKEPKTTVQLWGDGQVCGLLPRADENNRLEAKQLADKQEKEEGYAPLYWLVIHTGFLPAG